MELYVVWCFALGTFLLLHAAVLPRLRIRLAEDRTADVLGPLAWFKVSSLLRTVALAVLLGTSLMWLGLWLLTLRGTATLDQVTATLGWVRRLQDAAHSLDLGLMAFTVAGLAGGLGWLTYRQSNQQANQLFEEIRRAEAERVITAYKEDAWEALPPTETMSQLSAFFEQRLAQAQQAREAGDEAGASKAEEELDELRSLYFRIDADRRMVVEVPTPFADDLVLPPSASRADRLREAVLNRGVLKSLSAGTRAVAFVGLMLALPAAGTLALALGTGPIEQQVVRLDAVRIQLTRAEAERQLAEAMKKAQVATRPTPAMTDEEAEAALAHNFDRDFNQQLALRAAPMAVRAHLAQARVRESILHQYAEHNPHVSALAGADETHAVHSVDLESGRERVRRRLQAIRTENAVAWQNLKSALPTRADFATAATRGDISRALGGEVYRAAFAGGAQELVTSYESHAVHYISELAQGGDLERARARSFEPQAGQHWTSGTQARLQTLNQSVDAEGQLLERAMREHPPTLHAHPHSSQQIQDALKAMEGLPPSLRQAQALYGYSDLLPGRMGDELRTAAAKAVDDLHPGSTGGGGGGGGGGSGSGKSGHPSKVKGSKVAFDRSYSYKSLRGFSRVGGVLIGRPPESGKVSADIVGFEWVRQPGEQVMLKLQSRDGAVHSFGPYAPSLVLQAMTYAADRRPLAVTMITAEPVPDLKIITHPALLDTPTGCRAVMIDRFADEATSSAPYRREAVALVQASHALYQMAWGLRVGRIADEHGGLTEQAKRSINEQALSAATSGEEAVARSFGMLRAAMRSQVSLPVNAKPAFYDTSLVQQARDCVNSSDAMPALRQCLSAAPTGGASRLEALLKHFPKFQVWSGVREVPYEVDPKLSFLRPGNSSNSLWPFDFVLQTAFASRGLIGDEDITDQNPWEFPTVHDALMRDVAQLVARNPQRQAVLSTMRDFTVVQRLFRTALAGQMGAGFPLEKFTLLARELNQTVRARGTKGYKTPRWNTNSVELSFAMMLHRRAQAEPLQSANGRALAQRAPGILLACAQASRSAGTAGCALGALKTGAAGVLADSPASEADKAYATEVRAMAGILDLRRALGVLSPENRAGETCPAL